MNGMTERQSTTPMPNCVKQSKDPDWERRQRLREYRVAARREKRNRKADEKKQRKLNATILRRMTRNPEKYTKNAQRNHLRAIEGERRTIRNEALRQVQRLAAVHDPSGVTFNIGPVIIQDNGIVISIEALQRRDQREKAKQAEKTTLGSPVGITNNREGNIKATGPGVTKEIAFDSPHGLNLKLLKQSSVSQVPTVTHKSRKSQLKKVAALEPRIPPPKPIIPDGIALPEGEEDWLALWDLPDDQVERRVARAKKHKAAARKALRVKQQSGKVERRAARDEKRKIYRDLKLTWRTMKEEEKRHKTKLKSAEDHEAKRIAVSITTMERHAALDRCIELGFTLSNTPGVDAIRPKALGMKGRVVDFDRIELRDAANDVMVEARGSSDSKNKRVDLSTISRTEVENLLPSGKRDGDKPREFIELDLGEDNDYEPLSYNHKLRRKLRRAVDSAQINKEQLVRERAKEWCKENEIETPPELVTSIRPDHRRGQRVLENGELETEKRERVRARLELTEYNKAAKILRKQAKQIAEEAGLRVYAEMTGKMPPKGSQGGKEVTNGYGPGWQLPDERLPENLLLAEAISVG